jgi:hypothetical protein
MAQNMINEQNSSPHEEINTPMPTHNSWQPRINCRMCAGRSVIEDAVERNSWGKSGCEWMCRFPNIGGLHCTSGDAPLETHTLTHNTSSQPRTNYVCPCRCCRCRLRPPPLFTIDCAAVAMAAINGSNTSSPQWKRRLMAAAAMASLPPDHHHCHRHHWPKTPLLKMPLRHHPSSPPPPLSTMTTTVDKYHHCRGHH